MKNKSSGIGGQAVLEGIMMKHKDKYAVAVRKPDKDIVVDVKEFKSITEKVPFFGLPFIRGIFNFVESMVVGIKTLTYSAEFIEEEEVSNKDQIGDKVAKTLFREKAESALMFLTVLFSIVLSVALFIVLPYYIAELSKLLVSINSNTVLAIIEGVVRILIFILYIVLISKMEDIKRTFMYHGAEHKCINCIESGFPLNVENVRKSSRLHKRCGTSFLLFVMFISIVSFILLSALLPEDVSRLYKVLLRLVLIPFIAGFSYEIIRLAGRTDNIFVRIISAPGMFLQNLTTKEPEDDMIEVAIRAIEEVFDWEEYQKNMAEEIDENILYNS